MRKQLIKMMNSIVNKFSFGSDHKKDIQKKLWENIFNRALLTKREAHGIMGLLNKIKKKLI